MTLLDDIIKVSTNPFLSDEPLNYPLPLNSDSILKTLKIDPQNLNFTSPIPVSGFEISQLDSILIELNSKFFKKLKRKLKSPQSLTSETLIGLINPFLEKIGEKKLAGLGDLELGDGGDDYCCKLIEKFGSLVAKDALGLVIEGCILVGNWRILETLIVKDLVDHGLCSDLLFNLVSKSRSGLVCLCVKHFRDLKTSDLGMVLKYFLSAPKEGLVGTSEVRKEWEREALLSIEKVSDVKLNEKKSKLAKEAALLLMMAYDGFASWELCLHYVISCAVVDDVVFSGAISKLNAEEMLGLIQYLGKWLRKYERFPQAGPCPKAASILGLNVCQWVPKLEDVVKCFGLVVDEHFASLALHLEFHEELRAIEEVVSSLASEGRLCCAVANSIEILKPEVGGA